MNERMKKIWHDPDWRPVKIVMHAGGSTEPAFVCVHELENGNGQCRELAFFTKLQQHSCEVEVEDVLERLYDLTGEIYDLDWTISELAEKASAIFRDLNVKEKEREKEKAEG